MSVRRARASDPIRADRSVACASAPGPAWSCRRGSPASLALLFGSWGDTRLHSPIAQEPWYLARFHGRAANTEIVSPMNAVDLALVLAVDGSASVTYDEFGLIAGGMAAALREPPIIAALIGGPAKSSLLSL